MSAITTQRNTLPSPSRGLGSGHGRPLGGGPPAETTASLNHCGGIPHVPQPTQGDSDMTPSRATTNSCNLPDQEKALFEPTPLRATAAPASAGRRGGATITLRLPVTRLQTKEVTGEDGFVISAPVPVTTMKDFDFCARNIECSCLHGSGDKEAARALEHHPRECGRPHYNPRTLAARSCAPSPSLACLAASAQRAGTSTPRTTLRSCLRPAVVVVVVARVRLALVRAAPCAPSLWRTS